MSALFPMFMKLENKRCLVVGAGKVGQPKIASLLDTGALVHIVAFGASEVVRKWAQEGKIKLELRAFTAADLDGIFLAVVATASRELNASIYNEAQRRGVLCNVVDDPAYCDFYYPAVVRRGDLQIAISTNGRSPALSQKLRQQLERQFGPGYAQWVAQLGETRKLVLASDLPPQKKRELLLSLASREAVQAAVGADRAKKESADKESAKEKPAKGEFAETEWRVTV
jgi:precorrin-2 dehydrogenase / sirohydrochlorin ferrochelatase